MESIQSDLTASVNVHPKIEITLDESERKRNVSSRWSVYTAFSSPLFKNAALVFSSFANGDNVNDKQNESATHCVR